MNFFEQQDHARRQTRKLIILFSLAVLAIVIVVDAALALAWMSSKTSGSGASNFSEVHRTLSTGFFVWSSLLTLLVIAGGTLFEMARLKDGGDTVAQMVGGRLVSPSSTDLHERRLLNIVEEMALASGIACPRVYILDNESAINAFAAGYHQNEAVVAVTHGTLHRLTRDELQGVIGHEFSHILNGDMRLNIKLIGLLFGIQMLALIGRGMIDLRYFGGVSVGNNRDSRRSSNEGVFLFIGIVLFVVGYIGIFFGRLIKAAVSRQREFLADASSVQFTRNPDGIGGALRKIGGLTRSNQCGSRIDNTHAEEFSHLFLGAARPQLLSGLFATHPPLEERLKRVYGRSMTFLDAEEVSDTSQNNLEAFAQTAHINQFGTIDYVTPSEDFSASSVPSSAMAQKTVLTVPTAPTVPLGVTQGAIASGLSGIAFGRHAGGQASGALSIPKALADAARVPQSACALVFALLLDDFQSDGFTAQCALLEKWDVTLATQSRQLFEGLKNCDLSVRMPLLDIAAPALKLLSPQERLDLLSKIEQLIAADQKVTQTEFVIQAVLDRRLAPNAGRNVPIRYTKLAQLKSQVNLLINLMAQFAFDKKQMGAALQATLKTLPELDWLADGQLEEELLNTKKLIGLDFFAVRHALRQLNQLTPLAKPQLIRLLLAVAGNVPAPEAADLFKAICAAIDSPLPEGIGQTYSLADA